MQRKTMNELVCNCVEIKPWLRPQSVLTENKKNIRKMLSVRKKTYYREEYCDKTWVWNNDREIF